MRLKKITAVFIILLLGTNTLLAQHDSSYIAPPYKVNFKYEVPAAIVGLGLTQYFYTKIPDVAALTPAQALALDRKDVNRFDRSVINFPISGHTKAHNNSNYVMYSTFALPGILMLDKNIRRDWKAVSTMYFQVHAVSSTTYLAVGFPTRRARPLAYKNDYPIELRSGKSTYNSFFSGHVNSTAATSFFMAKIYCDYHDLSFVQKALIYSAASIPPAVVASYRMRAGKHFRTDVLTGFALGAATGILVPELHKKRKNNKLTYLPIINQNMIGLNMSYNL